MLQLAFIGGAIAGAAGLTAAALWDKSKTEAQFPSSLKNAASLDEQKICSLLNDYYLKSNALAIKVSNYVMESSGPAYFATLEMPDESMFEKAFRAAADKITPTMRKWRIEGMMDLKNEAEKLYGRYRGAFKRANELLKERGRTPISLKNITFKGVDFSMNNSIENDDWGLELNELADRIRKFLDDSADITEHFVQIFEGKEPALALGADTVCSG